VRALDGSTFRADLVYLRRCFFAGGVKFSEQGFKDTAPQLDSSLLVISVIGASL
jgi:Ca2+:H+ antiporter